MRGWATGGDAKSREGHRLSPLDAVERPARGVSERVSEGLPGELMFKRLTVVGRARAPRLIGQGGGGVHSRQNFSSLTGSETLSSGHSESLFSHL